MAKAAFSFPQFRALLDRVDAERIETFAAIEQDFLSAMSAFDRRMAAGESRVALRLAAADGRA